MNPQEVEELKNNVLSKAKSYVGTQEGDAKHKELINQYNAVKPLPVGYPVKYTDDWCAAFVTVIGDLTNVSEYIGRECGVQRFVKIFKNKGIWRGLAKPQAGDIIVFDWQKNGWADHIGFVEKVDGNKITTIEGNTSKQVARRTYAWNDWRVSGYARPKYPSGTNTTNKSINEVTHEVLNKKWGNGNERKQRLTQAGYNAQAVQNEVNRLLKTKGNLKSNETIAKEVIAKQWGNGETRKQRLTEAGYDYNAIQKAVNQLMKSKNSHLKTNETVAKEVIQQKWGNGQTRKQRLTEAGYDYDAVQKIVNSLI